MRQRQVLDGLPGCFVVPPDADSIAAAVRRAAALGPEQRDEHAAAVRARVSSSYSLRSLPRRLLTLYDEALGGGQRR